MKLLILGGTSFFGKEIARCFAIHGHSVTRFTRGNQPLDNELNINEIKGDRNNFADLQRAAKADQWDVVIDNVAYNGDDVRQGVKAFAAVPHYILTSTISVYRFNPDQSAQPFREDTIDFDYNPDEEDPNNEHWIYARGKLEAEKALIRQDTTSWTIVRPSVVYGPYDVKNRGFWYLARILENGPIIGCDGALNTIRLTYSRDLAMAYLSVAEQAVAKGKIYNVAQEELISLKDFLEESAYALGRKLNLVSVPYEIAGDFGGPLAYNRNWICDIELVKRELNFRPTPWREFAAKTACWFRDCCAQDRNLLLKTRREELDFLAKWSKLIEQMRPTTSKMAATS